MPESRFVEVNGVRLHYLEWPDNGRPIVIVHGNGHCGGVFAPLADRLADTFHPFTLDLRGHGLSEKPGSYLWPEFRDEVAGFLDALDLHDVLLVAHSRGGGVSLLAAAKSSRVSGVAVYEPTLPHTPSLQMRLAELVERTLKRRAVFPSRDEMYEHFKKRSPYSDWQDEFVRSYVEHGGIETEDGRISLSTPPEVEAFTYETMLQDEEWAHVGVSELPVLGVYGEHNARLREGTDLLATLQRYFPRTTMTIQAGSTHSGIFEHPDAFEASVRGFAASL